jgi:chromosome segregation ATPase
LRADGFADNVRLAMPKLREFISHRVEEITAAWTPLLERRNRLREELDAVLAEMQSLQREFGELQTAASAIGVLNEDEKKPAPTIKEAVVAVLQETGRALTALEILSEINSRYFDGKISRTSLSPQLSRLKRSQDIELNGSLWSLNVTKKKGSADTAEPSFFAVEGAPPQKQNPSADYQPPSPDCDPG